MNIVQIGNFDHMKRRGYDKRENHRGHYYHSSMMNARGNYQFRKEMLADGILTLEKIAEYALFFVLKCNSFYI